VRARLRRSAFAPPSRWIARKVNGDDLADGLVPRPRPGRFADQQDQQGERQAAQADGKQRRLPALDRARAGPGQRGAHAVVPVLQEHAAQHHRGGSAQERAREVGAQRGGAVLLGEHVGQQRIRAGIGHRLADTHADAGKGQRGEAARRAAQRGHHRPQRDTESHQLAARQRVGNPAHGDADDRIEHGKGRPQDEAEVGVVEPEIGLDRLGEDRDDLPVEVVEQVRRGHEDQREPGGGRDAGGRGDRDGRIMGSGRQSISPNARLRC
jgi:hypothetical protein